MDVEKLCLRNQPDGPLKCELPQGPHKEHQAYSVALGRVVTWPNASVKAKPPKSSTTRSGLRKTSIRQQSDKQVEKKELWRFIKACFIICQRRTLGYTQCMRCGRVNPPKLELHHMDYAGRGGEWSPRNAELICAGAGSCHDEEHGVPEWSAAS